MPDLKGNPVVGEARKDLGGFRKFLLRGNVVDLAVGVIIGAAFGDVVKALAKDIFQPLIQAFGGQPNAEGLTFTVGRATFQVGDLINALISFLLIAFVVYFFVVLPVNKLMDKYKPQPQPAPTKDCPECTNKIPKAARRCPECAAQLMPPSDEVAEAMRQVGAPSGAQIADHAAKALASRLTGEDGSSSREP